MKIDNSMKFFVGDTAATKILLGSTLLWPLSLGKNNKIIYTSTSGDIICPRIFSNSAVDGEGFGANIVSNEYKDGIGVITFDGDVTLIGHDAFRESVALTSIIIPDSVQAIAVKAFRNCDNLTSVTIGNGTTGIGDYAFEYCESLKNITFGDSMKWIGYMAFKYCTSLTSITIPHTVQGIDQEAFCNCEKLKTVYCKAVKPPAGDTWMFHYNAYGRRIYVPAACVTDYKNADFWNEYASSIYGYDFNQ